MAHIIRVSGAKDPYTGTTLKELQAAVGGPIETVYGKGEHAAIVAVIRQDAPAGAEHNPIVSDMIKRDVRGDAVVLTWAEYETPRKKRTSPAGAS